MNSREQYLLKQNERLANQTKVLMTAFENLHTENEYMASVACAFAWDLAINIESVKDVYFHSDPGFNAAEMCGDVAAATWSESIAAVEKLTEAE